MQWGHQFTAAVGAAAIAGLVALSGVAAWAQEATPEAEDALVPRPVHIHSGSCDELGDVVQPLTDLTAPQGDRVGLRRADLAETSFTNVPLTLDAILAEDHAINAHLSAEEIGTYIACGNIGGVLNDSGALVVGLSEDSNSGYTGIAFLAPGADGASTDVSVFIAQTQGGGRDGGGDAEADAAATPVAAADTGDELMVAGEQVPVSLIDFAIEMPDTLPAGPVTFAVTNDGQSTHSFEIEGAGIEEELEARLEPGQSGMLSVNLEPGTYEVYCPVGSHADRGMRVEVTVA
jgi:uncharacterized cupredoxin-like copper-binding protein